MYENQHGVR